MQSCCMEIKFNCVCYRGTKMTQTYRLSWPRVGSDLHPLITLRNRDEFTLAIRELWEKWRNFGRDFCTVASENVSLIIGFAKLLFSTCYPLTRTHMARLYNCFRVENANCRHSRNNRINAPADLIPVFAVLRTSLYAFAICARWVGSSQENGGGTLIIS